MLKQVVLEALGDNDVYRLYGTDNTETAIEQLVLKAMRDGQRMETHELVREMLDEGSLVMTVEGQSVTIEKGNAI